MAESRPPKKGSAGGRDPRRSGRPTGKSSGGPKREGRRDSASDRSAPRGDRRGPRDDRRQNWRSDEERRTEDQKIYDGPTIPDDVEASDLGSARKELQGIPEKLADKVARQLVMAARLLAEGDVEKAHEFTKAARSRALRNGLVREAVGETAYACGHWHEALAEFRAARRITGRVIYAPMMADCERALGRPTKALEYDTPEIRSKLDDDGNVDLTIVMAGARRDLGQIDAALCLLESERLMAAQGPDWLPRLRYAYADTLLAAGRTNDANEWFHRTVAVDPNGLTDAEDRITDAN